LSRILKLFSCLSFSQHFPYIYAIEHSKFHIREDWSQYPANDLQAVYIALGYNLALHYHLCLLMISGTKKHEFVSRLLL